MARVTSSINGTSRTTTRAATDRGRIIAVMPRIRPMLARFDPITFPTARSEFPPSAATVQTTNSGADVPKETTVRPTTMGLTPREPANLAAPRTSHSAPK
jgi:hypothetical protein